MLKLLGPLARLTVSGRHVAKAQAPAAVSACAVAATSVGVMRSFHATALSRALLAEQALPAKSNQIIALHSIRDNPGARKKPKRVGRGPGSGLGKTCGRGQKGLYARRRLGKRPYEGGQSPLYKRTPRIGMRRNKVFEKPFDVVNLWKLGMFVRNGRLDPSKTITLKAMQESGLLSNSRIKFGVKLLANGGPEALAGLPPLDFEVSHASKTATEAVEAAGGSVTFKYFNRVGLRAHLKPEKFHPNMLPRGDGLPKPSKAARYAVENQPVSSSIRQENQKA